ncbi:hypothetical protein L7F22_019599 [Adiantum nelumboides]|nr:hypothetical protein [Adiantum nelumboides]
MPRIPYVPVDLAGPIADAIRARRGDRGLIALDRSLLHAPPVAEGWNKLLGAIRTGSDLSDDLREIIILRVAVRNGASYEWISHSPVAKKGGVTDEQLAVVGDLYNRIDKSKKGKLSPVQQACLQLADEMTQYIKVRDETFENLKGLLAQAKGPEAAEKQITEAVATCATYNMVSRFLVAMNVADHNDISCPVPGLPENVEATGSVAYPASSFNYSHGLVQVAENVKLATKVHFHSVQAPWIVFVNSLMTNLTMWDAILPAFAAHFNIVTYDQRGHGASDIPPSDNNLDELADDIAAILDALGIERAHAVIGVSQGGATTLNFAIRHGALRCSRVVVCDTQAISPEANTIAWNERKALARKEGMGTLADQTIPRWFPIGQSKATDAVRANVWQMVAKTSIEGFSKSASALQGYDLVKSGVVEALQGKQKPTISTNTGTTSAPLQTLFVAGALDGKLPDVLQELTNKVGSSTASFTKIDGAGHLPMCDNSQAFVDAVLTWLLQK